MSNNLHNNLHDMEAYLTLSALLLTAIVSYSSKWKAASMRKKRAVPNRLTKLKMSDREEERRENESKGGYRDSVDCRTFTPIRTVAPELEACTGTRISMGKGIPWEGGLISGF